MSRIFISYRRQEGSKDAMALFERLTRRFGEGAVFMDVEGIALGVDFQEVLDRTLDTCSVMLLLMGPDWAEAQDESGERRLDDPDDFVRVEVATALRRKIPLIPVFLDGARMPRANRLPEDLAALPRRQGMPLDHVNWRAQTARLIESLERWLQPQQGGSPAPREPKPGEVFRDAPDAPEMVVVPAGTFTMGSPDDEAGRTADEGPQHQVRIARAFALGRYAVTVAEFGRFVKATGYRTEAERNPDEGIFTWNAKKSEWGWCKGKSWRDPGMAQADNHPVVGVSWNDAVAYVKWLSEKTAKPYRLPSESEWEYAARADSTTRYPWGNDPGTNRANFYGSGSEWSGKQTAPVGSFEPNAFGLYDMIGNVWEWLQDCWNDSYKGAPADGSAWESGDCGLRVVRGGSWFARPGYARVASRGRVGPSSRSDDQGFRLARTL